MSVDVVKEMLTNHSDAEVIAYLDSVMTGLLQNYKIATKQNQPELLYSNLGDIAMVASIIRAMKKRNDAIAAQKEA